MKPYEYLHIYHCLIESNYGSDWVEYPMHCDYPKARDKRNISELKCRMQIAYPRIRLKRINIIKQGKNGSKINLQRPSKDEQLLTASHAL
jgi:hypothetical protein